MNRYRSYSTIFLPAGDLILVIAVFMASYWLRHYVLSGMLLSGFGIGTDFSLSAYHYFISGVVMGAVEVFMLQAFGIYRREFGLAHIEELAWIIRSSFMAVVITFAFSFITKQLFFSRFVLIFSFPATAIMISIWHHFFHIRAKNSARKRGKLINVAIYGTCQLASDLALFMETKASAPYGVIGYIRPLESSEKETVEPCCGSEDMFDWFKKNSVTELIIADTSISREERAELIYRCEQEGTSYKLIADVFALVSLTTRVVHMGGTTMIESVPPPLSGSRKVLKRILDLTTTAVLILLLFPVCLITAVAIAVSSGFPIFYTQTRLGINNHPFRMIKFRSMRIGAHLEKTELTDRNETSGPIFKIKQDPRVTAVGRFIRKWSIDELPQLFNVLSGQMSLVGPRPPLPEEVEEYSERHMKRLQTIPGITGVWQISGRSSLGFEEMVKLDLYYVDNWSVWMDLAILLLTPVAIFSRKGAY